MTSSIARRIGFMQGRLSPRIDGKIQAFPAPYWRREFALARTHDWSLMEWTLDAADLEDNPLMSKRGRQEIAALQLESGLTIPSCTGDCFMQSPFYKSTGAERTRRIDELRAVIAACSEIGIQWLVFPLVDNGSLTNQAMADDACEVLTALSSELRSRHVSIVFESDFEPTKLAAFIREFPSDVFGINYDIGNSASLGFDPLHEFAAYGARIYNVHVKDRMIGGSTVPLGTGNADFSKVFQLLVDAGYAGNFVLQTARADNDDHVEVALRYRRMVSEWWETFGGS